MNTYYLFKGQNWVARLLQHDRKELNAKKNGQVAWYRIAFFKMCKRANVHGRLYVICSSNDSLTASSQYYMDTVFLTSRLVHFLDHDSLLAILAHEVGHLHNTSRDQFFQQVNNCITLILFAFCDAWLGYWYAQRIGFSGSVFAIAILVPVLLMIFYRPISMLLNMVLRKIYNDECSANLYGAKLVGLDKMLHLLKTFQKLEEQEGQYLRDSLKLMVVNICPIGFIYELFYLFLYDLHHFLAIIGVCAHPTYRQQIRDLLKRKA